MGLCIGLLLVLSAACTTERNPCLEPVVPKLNVGCYQYNPNAQSYVDTLLPNANFVSFDIDSAHFWYWGAKRINKFALVLSPMHDTVRWALQVDSGFAQIDTITFIYNKQLKFYSTACGYGYTYALTQVLSTARNLDSVRISNNAVTTKAGIEHVKIYF
jgi:hypothetical protein